MYLPSIYFKGEMKEEMEFDMGFLNELQLAVYVFQTAVSSR